MKTKLLILLLGITIGIGGEFLIPQKYFFGQTSGCLKDGEYVLIPEGYLYNSKTDKYPIPLFLERGFIPSYKFFLLLATKKVSWLPKEECNKLIELRIEHPNGL